RRHTRFSRDWSSDVCSSDLDGHYGELVHANNPSHYVSEIHDHGHLEAMRRMDIILATGQEDAFVDNNRYLSRILWEKGVGNALQIGRASCRERAEIGVCAEF